MNLLDDFSAAEAAEGEVVVDELVGHCEFDFNWEPR
jgi:hypothetical protein